MERDYLRSQILKIFEEDERALQDNDGMKLRSKSLDGHLPVVGEASPSGGVESNEIPKADSTPGGTGSVDLPSRDSLRFIDVDKTKVCYI